MFSQDRPEMSSWHPLLPLKGILTAVKLRGSTFRFFSRYFFHWKGKNSFSVKKKNCKQGVTYTRWLLREVSCLCRWVAYLTSLLNSQGLMSDGQAAGQDEGSKCPRLENPRFRTWDPVVWSQVCYRSTKRTAIMIIGKTESYITSTASRCVQIPYVINTSKVTGERVVVLSYGVTTEQL